MRTRAASVFIALAVSAISARAEIPFFVATAEGPQSLMGGIAANDNFYAMHRFYLSEPLQLTGVGGQFENPYFNQTFTVFAAIVELSGPTDFPDSLDLSTPDLKAHTLLTIPPGDADREASLSIGLNSGWYALGFGTGRFGAPETPVGSGVALMSRTVDLAPDQLPFSALQTFSGGPGFFQVQSSQTPRMFLRGTVVPEPNLLATVALLGLVTPRFNRRSQPHH